MSLTSPALAGGFFTTSSTWTDELSSSSHHMCHIIRCHLFTRYKAENGIFLSQANESKLSSVMIKAGNAFEEIPLHTP